MDESWLVVDDDLRLPEKELQVQFVTGGGPGGQHVNKAATRVLLSFDVANSPSLGEAQRARLLEALGSRLDSRGVLTVAVHETRSQARNRAIATARLLQLLAEALVEPAPRLETEPPPEAVEQRLEAKRRRAQTKKRRRWRPEPE